MTNNKFTRRLAVLGAAVALTLGAGGAQAAGETIKVGVLHSLTGTMAISETTLKDTVLMMIDEQNKKGRHHQQKTKGTVGHSTRF